MANIFVKEQFFMEKMKKRLALLLAVLMVFTMSIPTGLVAFAAPGDPGEPGP